jgi:hypothetical protein
MQSDEMRLRAKQYREEAETCGDSEVKAILIKTAEIWERLATRRDRASARQPVDDKLTDSGADK